MSDRNTAGDYPAYRAPTDNERALITPVPTGLVPAALIEQLRVQEPEHVTAPGQPLLCGTRLDAVRAQARCEAVQLAVRFTSRYRHVGDLGFCRMAEIAAHAEDFQAAGGRPTRPIVLTGHQPELFHPGVWFKNFLASHLAGQLGGIAINFLVDNDICRSTAIRVPSAPQQQGVIAQSIPFDDQRDAIPWELRQPLSRQTWDSFPQRVAASLLPLSGGRQRDNGAAGEGDELVLEQLWPLATAGLDATNRLGLAISQGRHQLEQSLGLKTLEVPLSWLADTESFARFCLAILNDLLEFQQVYNDQLDRYRQAHQIRNHAHPVPPLERQHEWLEAPLWVYRKGAPVRQRLWVSRRRGQMCLTDRAGWQACIEGSLEGDQAVDQWRELLADGVCLRPRALLTTMYTRLFVSDLFVHGIGGGKYDQLTDAIIADFFRLPPPPMVVASATVRLPLDVELVKHGSSAETEQEILRQREQIWRGKFHGDELILDDCSHNQKVANEQFANEQFLGEVPAEEVTAEVARLQEHKRALLANIPPRGHKWEWHHEITAVNKRLAALAEPKIRRAMAAVDTLTTVERQQRLLESREFSFALFPRGYIADVLNRLCKS